MTALEAASARHAAGVLEELEEAAYNPFQLLVADEQGAWLTVYRDRPRIQALEAGVHVVGNVEEDGTGEAIWAAARKEIDDDGSGGGAKSDR